MSNTNNNIIYKNLRNFMLSALLLVLSSISISLSSNSKEDKIKFFKPVIDTLLNRGVDSAFIMNLLNDDNVAFNEKFVMLNVSSALKKTKPDYTKHYNKRSINKTKIFITENIKTLERAEAMYQVPREVIASILWIETRLGGYTGKNNIVSVFLSTAMANQTEFVNLNLDVIHSEYKGETAKIKKLNNKIKARAKKKSQWAFKELEALEKVSMVSPIPIAEIKGSWAGAFGLSQFLPSSYMAWAVDGNYDGKINLFEKSDAIFSIGNYLKTNGWGDKIKEKRAAVFHYNRSQDYVDAVLKLANFLKI